MSKTPPQRNGLSPRQRAKRANLYGKQLLKILTPEDGMTLGDGVAPRAAALIARGADMALCDGKSRPALTLVIQYRPKGWEQLVDQLLQARARVTADDFDAQPLVWAFLRQDAALMRRLVAAGSDVNCADPGGNTLLMGAAMSGRAEMMQALLALGARVDVQNAGGYTPLMQAALSRKGDCLSLLLAAGADITLRAQDGRDVVQIEEELIGKLQARILKLQGDDPREEIPDIEKSIRGHRAMLALIADEFDRRDAVVQAAAAQVQRGQLRARTAGDSGRFRIGGNMKGGRP